MPSQQRISRDQLIYVVTALLFLTGCTAYTFLVLNDSFRYPDESDYYHLARNIAALQGYSLDGESPTANRPPGYSFLLAPLLGIAQSIDAVRIAQYLLILLSSWWLGSLVSEQTGISVWRCATVVIGGVCAYPVLIYTAGTLFPQIALLMCLSALIIQLTRPHNSWLRAAGVGALTAFIAQISPTALVAIPIAVAYTFCSSAWTRQQSVVLMISAALMLGGWMTRNWIVLGEPIVFSKNLAHNIDNAVLELDPLEADEIRPPGNTLEYAMERLEQFAGSPQIYAYRVAEYFAYRNDLYVDHESTPLRDVVMFITYYGLLSIVIARMLFIRRMPLSHAEILVLALYIGTALFHALVFSRIRYRLPFDFLLLLPAANFVLLMPELFRHSRLPILLRHKGS